jgi:hypothetical protein
MPAMYDGGTVYAMALSSRSPYHLGVNMCTVLFMEANHQKVVTFKTFLLSMPPMYDAVRWGGKSISSVLSFIIIMLTV